MKFLVLIQARCGSSRLPNKVLSRFGSKTDIEWVIDRVGRSRLIDEIIVVTSIEKNNLPIIQLCAEKGIRVFVGSEDDVLDRFYQVSRLIEPEYIIRITADCPLFDWNYLDMAIEQMDDKTDYLWEDDQQFPDGLDLEIVKYTVLKQIWHDAELKSEREHVTLFIRNHSERYSIKKIDCPISGIGDKRWTLDEEEDYILISRIYDYFLQMGKEDFETNDILAFLSKNPELERINEIYTRNEGLAKSLANDKRIERHE